MPHASARPAEPAPSSHAVPALPVSPRGAQLDPEAALRLLAEAGEVLASSLEVGPTLEAVARLTVPAFADSCTIDLLAPDGALARVTAAHRDPAAQARLRGLRERFPLDRRRPHPVNRALETGEIQLVPAVTDELLAQWARSEEERREAEHVRATSAILAPLRARGRTLGVVSFGTFGERQPFSAADLPLAQDLARRAAVAVDNARLFEAERAARALSEVAADRTARLQAVTAALSQPLSRADAARVIVGQILGALGAYAGAVLELTEDGAEFEILHAEGFMEEAPVRHRRYPAEHPNLVRDVARTHEPVLLGSTAEWLARYPDPPAGAHLRDDGAWAALPLLAEGRVLGVLTLLFPAPRAFSSADREFMMAFARHCSQALERARLHEGEWRLRARAEKAAERTGRLQAVTAALTVAASPAEVAAAVVEEGAAAVGARSGSLILLTPDGEHLELAHGLHVPASLVEHYRRFPLDAAFPPAEVVRTGEPVFVDTLEERAARYPLLEDVRRDTRTAAVGSVPVAIEGRVLGALSFALPDDAPGFAPEDRALLVALGRLCAHALERARLYEEAQRARAEAEAANRAKAEFLAVLSHELRTPLNAIGGYADLMLAGVQGPLPPGYRSYVERITAGQRHLLGLINAVLSFARVEAGHVTWELETFALAEVLAALETLVEPQVRARGLAFACPPCDPSLAVHADREKVSQVVLNLLSNAIKFTEGGGWVAVEAAAADDMVEVRVADSGVGIPPDQLEHIFEPFVQVDSRLTRAADGVGLGLAISRELARGMGGELSVRSAPGQGSVFVLRLPRAAA